MKFKLDENLGTLGKSVLEADGHDVMTVAGQGHAGVDDVRLYEVCRAKERVLVTLDRDFGQVLRFLSEATPGIVVLESPGRLSPPAINKRIAELASVPRRQPIDRELWIVEPGRVRVHQKRT